MKSSMQIFKEMQQLETKEEMISYLRALPKKDEPWPDDPIESHRHTAHRAKSTWATPEPKPEEKGKNTKLDIVAIFTISSMMFIAPLLVAIGLFDGRFI